MQEITLYTDGGARGNPGPAGSGFVIKSGPSGAEKILKKCGNYFGELTNNQAEYLGLITALEWLQENGHEDAPLKVYMDSKLIVEQMRGNFKVKKPHLKKLWLRVHELLKPHKSSQFNHVKREDNEEADRLANLAMDMRRDVEE